jgi:hypothetical protein
MRRLAKHLSRPLLWLPLAAFAGCSLFAPEAPGPAAGTVPGHDLIASIRAAGEREKFIVDVSPLRDSGVTSLVEAAQRDEQARQYAAAAAKLDQALALSPDAPDLLQDRAEAAIGMRDFGRAEQLARHSWSIGPKLGSLCARNRQTIVVTRLQAGDLVGATAARQSVQQCHKAAVTRL